MGQRKTIMKKEQYCCSYIYIQKQCHQQTEKQPKTESDGL